MGKDANEESRSGSLESALNRRIDEPEEAGSSPASWNAEDVQASGSAPNPIESLFEPSEAVPAAQPTEAFPAARVDEAVPAAQPTEAFPAARVDEAVPAAQPTEAFPAAPVDEAVPTAAFSAPRPAHLASPLPASRNESEDFADEVFSDQGKDMSPHMTKKGRRKWPWVVLAAAVVLGGAYVGAGYFFADRVPANTKVAGVSVGGMTKSQASAKLEAELTPKLSEAVTVTAGSDSTEHSVDPSSFDLGIDEDATINSIVGFSLEPARIWAHVSGGSNVDPVLTYDADKLASTVDSLAQQVNTDATDATVSFAVGDGSDAVPTVQSTQSVQGVALDTDAAAEKLSTVILTASQPIRLDVSATDPAIDDAAAATAVETANTLISDKLSVTVGGKLVEITPAQLASAASFTATDGTLDLSLDGKALGDVVRSAASDVLKKGTDAVITIVDHTTPTISPSTDGVGIDDDDLATQALAAATSTNRSIELTTVEVPAEFTTEDAEAMGIKEVVSSIETPLTSDSVRTTNLLVGTKLITNTLVKPDETFSLLDALGEITEARGFTSSGVVANGFNSTALGGGLSQLSTNTFNIGYLAGLVDVEHKPHSKYFSRYPMGREATLWSGQIDMKWQNNTPYGVMIDTWVADGYVHSQLWSTKYWDVTTTTSDPYNQTSPTTEVNTASDCTPSAAGGNGFTVKVSRTVSHDGVVNEDVSGSYTWTYSPVNAVKCN
ncbi:VanW family protein [Changpingibacter yushuensis]|uniref:VanW family protein n=1 Tax=Changpingibacter yushuensis TaxID=2758440 RepID=UPI00165D93DD|nr:VanW family protein [Changpingibacter yushuensis]